MRIIMEPLHSHEERAVILEEWVSKTLREVQQYKADADEALRAVLGAGYDIDEMALMFTSPSDLERWVTTAVRLPGVALFNSADDVVTTQPIHSHYHVHYWFLTAPELPGGEIQPWRIEAMYPQPGSPLHDAHLRQTGQGEVVIVHASFRCPDEEAYGVAVKALRDHGYDVAQKCESTYGRFSYWAPAPGSPLTRGGVYLKPRVNLRDAEVDHED